MLSELWLEMIKSDQRLTSEKVNHLSVDTDIITIPVGKPEPGDISIECALSVFMLCSKDKSLLHHFIKDMSAPTQTLLCPIIRMRCCNTFFHD